MTSVLELVTAVNLLDSMRAGLTKDDVSAHTVPDATHGSGRPRLAAEGSTPVPWQSVECGYWPHPSCARGVWDSRTATAPGRLARS